MLYYLTKNKSELRVVADACNLSGWKADAGGFQVHGLSE
jgi:hypothetical protein